MSYGEDGFGNLNIDIESKEDRNSQSRTESLLRDVQADFVWVSEKEGGRITTFKMSERFLALLLTALVALILIICGNFHMGSTDSRAMGSKGAHWTSKIYFDPDADGDGSTPIEWIEDSQIRAAMKKYENETIQHAGSYKIPLREWQWWDFQIFYHEYVILKTDKAWWSIEKTNKGISLQKARSEETVVKMDRQKLRCSPKSSMQPKLIKEAEANITMLELANIIYIQDLLHKTYNV